MAGSWVEGLYITTQISIISKNSEDMLKIIANQKEPLNKILELMKPYNNDNDIIEIVEALKPLSAIYATVGADKLTIEQFDQINKSITEIRNKIIQ